MSSGLYSGASGIALGVGLYRQVAGLWGGASGLVSGFGNPIPPLFASGSQGAWFDFTDTSTWYQDAARTTPAATLGDVVGLVLDKSRGLALGPELVTNGDFASGTTGWTADVATLSATGGVLTITNDSANFGGAFQSITTVAGKWYYFTTVLTFGTSNPVYVNLGTSAGGTQYGQIVRTSGGVCTFLFLATGTTAWVKLSNNNTSGATSGWSAVSVKLLAGNHASQATTAQKPLRARIPLGGRRNMLTYTEDFSNAAWAKSAITVTPNSIPSPDGGTNGTLLTQSSVAAYTQQQVTAATGTYTTFRIAKAGTLTWLRGSIYDSAHHQAWFNLSTGAVGTKEAGVTAGTIDMGNGWWLCWLTFLTTAVNPFSSFFATTVDNTVAAIGTFYSFGGQLEKTSPTAYQKVVAAWDVTESGVTSIPALYYDGSDDSLATAAIDFTGTDKMTVFAGVEKLSDAAQSQIVELTASTAANNGSFAVGASALSGTRDTYVAVSRGTFEKFVVPTGFTAPITNVLSALANISGASIILRANGAQVASDATSQGTGNYSNAALYIGRRAGSSLPFKGYMIGHMVIVGKLANASEIAAVEATERAATGAY